MYQGINALITIFVLGIGFIAYIILHKFGSDKSKQKQISVSGVSMGLFILSLVLILFSAYWIHTLTVNETKYDEVGPMGDLFNGLVAPFLSMIGIIAAGLAFYVQYQANRQVQVQFEVQQFESQFYEMLQLHRHNLDETVIEGYEFSYRNGDKTKPAIKGTKVYKETKGKKVFVTMTKEFEAIYLIFRKYFHNTYKNDAVMFPVLNSEIGERLLFNQSYIVFFLGTGYYARYLKGYEDNDQTGLAKGHLSNVHKELVKVRNNHVNDGIKEIDTYFRFRDNAGTLQSQKLWLSFNYKPFSGHQSTLAHYYRLLYQTVKFVTKQDEAFLTYEQKRDYLRILRALLSNHEQILLFYNWYVDEFGEKWEEKNVTLRTEKKGNYFFTDYRMIHNLPPDLLLNQIDLDRVFNSDYRNFRFEKGRRSEDGLFELKDIISNLK